MPDHQFNLDDLFKDDPEMQKLLREVDANPAPPAPARPPSLEDLQATLSREMNPQTPAPIPAPPVVPQTPATTTDNSPGAFVPFNFDAFFEQQQSQAPAAPVSPFPMPDLPQRIPTRDELSAHFGQNVLSEIPGAGLTPPKTMAEHQAEWEDFKANQTGKRDKTDKPMSTGRKILKASTNLLFWLTCIAAVLGSVLFATSNDPGKSYLGFRAYAVITGSMTPQPDSLPGGFNAGDMILIQKCNPEDIKVGDIITFNPSTQETGNTSFLTHRVVKVLDELGGKPGIYFVTKGDANPSEDPPISSEMLIGKKIFHIPAVGKILQSMRNNFLSWLMTVICFFAFIFMVRWYFAKPKPKKEADSNLPGAKMLNVAL